MKELETHDWIALAQLVSTHGMNLLLESLQAEEDIALEAVEMAKTREEEERAVMLWRCYRQVRGRILEILNYASREMDKFHSGEITQEDEV